MSPVGETAAIVDTGAGEPRQAEPHVIFAEEVAAPVADLPVTESIVTGLSVSELTISPVEQHESAQGAFGPAEEVPVEEIAVAELLAHVPANQIIDFPEVLARHSIEAPLIDVNVIHDEAISPALRDPTPESSVMGPVIGVSTLGLPAEEAISPASSDPTLGPPVSRLGLAGPRVAQENPALAAPAATVSVEQTTNAASTPAASTPASEPEATVVQLLHVEPVLPPPVAPEVQPQPVAVCQPSPVRVVTRSPAAAPQPPRFLSRTLWLLLAATTSAAVVTWWLLDHAAVSPAAIIQEPSPVFLPAASSPAATSPAATSPAATSPAATAPAATAPAASLTTPASPASLTSAVATSSPVLLIPWVEPSVKFLALTTAPAARWWWQARWPVAVPWTACLPLPITPESVFAFVDEPCLTDLPVAVFAVDASWRWSASGSWCVVPTRVAPAAAWIPALQLPTGSSWSTSSDLRAVPLATFAENLGWTALYHAPAPFACLSEAAWLLPLRVPASIGAWGNQLDLSDVPLTTFARDLGWTVLCRTPLGRTPLGRTPLELTPLELTPLEFAHPVE